jgi:hypothetical protein
MNTIKQLFVSAAHIITPEIEINADPLIKIKDGKLDFVFEKIDESKMDENPVKIISIIGNGRTGKSTFLNCMLTHLNGRTTKVFDTQDTDEHCTSGLDMFYSEEHNLILIDVQGLKLADSSHDVHLLLITYLISDIIIYNQKNILNNDIFDTLSPLASFINYLDIKSMINKPSLFFRLGDVDLKFDPATHLMSTLAPRKDQYQNIRNVFKTLFKDIDIGTTNSLDRTEKKLLNSKNFFEIVNESDNNFKKTIEHVLKICDEQPNTKNYKEWLTKIPKYVKKISDNEKINVGKLDTYQLLMKSEIMDFRDSIHPSNYLQIEINALQSGFDKYVQPRIDFMDNCLNQYEKKFKLVNSDIYDKYYKEIKVKFELPINTAIEKIEKLATIEIKSIFDSYKFKKVTSGLTDLDLKRQNIKNQINIFMDKISIYYAPVVLKYRIEYDEYIEKCNVIIAKQESEMKLNELKFTQMKTNVLNNLSKIYDVMIKLNNQFIDIMLTRSDGQTDVVFYDKSSDTFRNEIYNMYLIKNLFEFLRCREKEINGTNICEILNETYNSNYECVFNIKTHNIITNTCKSDSIYDEIESFVKELKLKLLNDQELKRITEIKFRQNKNIFFNSCNVIMYSDNCFVASCDCGSDECMSTRLKDKKNNNIYINFVEDEYYDLKKVMRDLKLVEFSRYIKKQYKKKKVSLDRQIMIEALIIKKTKHAEIRKLYDSFNTYYKLTNGLIDGITSI